MSMGCFDDIIILPPIPTAKLRWRAAVFAGGDSVPTNPSSQRQQWLWINGIDTGDFSGQSVSNGDVNADGFDDITSY